MDIDEMRSVINMETIRPTPLNDIWVFQHNEIRYMSFGDPSKAPVQSAMHVKHPDHLALVYTQMMMAASAVHQCASNILILGHGGGSLPRAIHALWPEAQVDIVDNDREVFNISEEYFNFCVVDQMTCHVIDATAFVKNLPSKRYDLILLDIFGKYDVPSDAVSIEFTGHIDRVLKSNGMVVANTFMRSEDHVDKLPYHYCWGSGYRLTDGKNSILMMMHEGRMPSMSTSHAKKLDEMGVDASFWLDRLERVNWRPEGYECVEYD